tara:strand:- start:643 stop:831 length:189 start_codon:yes stop_codon:yes gene_type:complete
MTVRQDGESIMKESMYIFRDRLYNMAFTRWMGHKVIYTIALYTAAFITGIMAYDLYLTLAAN